MTPEEQTQLLGMSGQELYNHYVPKILKKELTQEQYATIKKYWEANKSHSIPKKKVKAHQTSTEDYGKEPTKEEIITNLCTEFGGLKNTKQDICLE